MTSQTFTHLSLWGKKRSKGQNTIFAHISVTIHRMWSFKSYLNFDQSLKLGLKWAAENGAFRKSPVTRLRQLKLLKLVLTTKVTINHK